jgi:hypothetical protein
MPSTTTLARTGQRSWFRPLNGTTTAGDFSPFFSPIVNSSPLKKSEIKLRLECHHLFAVVSFTFSVSVSGFSL